MKYLIFGVLVAVWLYPDAVLAACRGNNGVTSCDSPMGPTEAPRDKPVVRDRPGATPKELERQKPEKPEGPTGEKPSPGKIAE